MSNDVSLLVVSVPRRRGKQFCEVGGFEHGAPDVDHAVGRAVKSQPEVGTVLLSGRHMRHRPKLYVE